MSVGIGVKEPLIIPVSRFLKRLNIADERKFVKLLLPSPIFTLHSEKPIMKVNETYDEPKRISGGMTDENIFVGGAVDSI